MVHDVTIMSFDAAQQILLDAIDAGAFPGASVEVGRASGPAWRAAFGHLTYDAGSPAVTAPTIYDLASLTKVVATTTLVMALVEDAAVRLEDRVGRWLPVWQGDDRAGVTVADLLSHASGLAAWLPLFRTCRTPREFASAIARAPLEYSPGTRSLYSDLGFILLGFLIEEAAGASLDELFDRLAGALELGEIRYRPKPRWLPRTAPTETDPWRGRVLVGEVHDENAAALGGIAGHAGLFGSADAVGRFARVVLAASRGETPTGWRVSAATVEGFTRRRGIPESSRALGWDTMVPTSSCGTLMSPRAFGHTGFTGTSLWIDPVLDLYAVLLTNRVHPTRDNARITAVRPAFHDAVVQASGHGH